MDVVFFRGGFSLSNLVRVNMPRAREKEEQTLEGFSQGKMEQESTSFPLSLLCRARLAQGKFPVDSCETSGKISGGSARAASATIMCEK